MGVDYKFVMALASLFLHFCNEEKGIPADIRRLLGSCYLLFMRRTTAILCSVVLAMLASPLRLPAASCILSNSPSHEACKMDCCANKTCCAVSKKSTTPVSQPLSKSGEINPQQMIGFVSVLLIDSIAVAASPQPLSVSASVRAHSPPPLAATCIRLI
jgi:hypothetical protein